MSFETTEVTQKLLRLSVHNWLLHRAETMAEIEREIGAAWNAGYEAGYTCGEFSTELRLKRIQDPNPGRPCRTTSG